MKLEPKEFDRLALEQIDLLYRVARRLTRDPNRAEDLVQETYLRALRSKESFNLEAFGMKPWLLRILYNLHVSRAQRRAASRWRWMIWIWPGRIGAVGHCRLTAAALRGWMSS